MSQIGHLRWKGDAKLNDEWRPHWDVKGFVNLRIFQVPNPRIEYAQYDYVLFRVPGNARVYWKS